MADLATLEGLPPEVLDNVLQFLRTPELRDLCYISRGFYDKSLAALYRDITFDWGHRNAEENLDCLSRLKHSRTTSQSGGQLFEENTFEQSEDEDHDQYSEENHDQDSDQIRINATRRMNFEGYRDESSEESFNTCSKKDLDRPPPVHLLLRTLLGRPSLASHVRSFALLGQLLWEKKHHLSDDDIALLNSPVPINIPWPLIIFDFAQYLPEERRTLRTEARTHLEGIYGITGFRSKLRLGKVLLSETLFSLLLSAFSNLQTLLIDSDFFKASDLDLFLASPGSNTSLKRLESVEFCRDFGHESDLHWHNPCRTRCVPQLLRLPKIRSLSLPLTPRRIRWLSPSPTLDLQSLMLHHCQLREEHLGELLHRTPTLRSLHYHAWINRTSVVRYGRNRDKYLDCNRLACSLKEVQHCLERLVITVKFFNDLRAEVPEVFTGFRGRLNCLSQFTRLKYVDVPYSMMLGQIAGEDRENLANMLPSSLRSLTISDNVEKDYVSLWLEEEFHSEVEAFLAWFSKQADGQFIPQLSVRWTSDEYMPSERIERLDDIFAELIYLGAEHNVIYSFSEDRCDF